MLYRTDIGGTRPLVQVDAPTIVTPVADARQESFERFAHIEMGKQMMAEIISRFDDGSFMVKIADTAARMNLPDGAKVGDSLPLTLIAREPRPTFLLGQQSEGAIATLSPAARLIGNLLRAAQQEGLPAGLVGKAALLPSPAGMQPAPLAATLQDTLVYSGLFYESHLAQWAQGERTRAELMREPQARFGREPSSASTAVPPKTEAPPVPFPAARGVGAAMNPYGESGHLQLDPQSGALVKVVTSMPQEAKQGEMPSLSREAAHMVGLQLDALDGNRFVWRGELWPGQPFEWEVSEETPRGQKGEAEKAEQVWSSVLRLALPTLGPIHASVQLTGDNVRLNLRADSEDAAGVLRKHGEELAAALQAVGTRLDFMGVSLDGRD